MTSLGKISYAIGDPYKVVTAKEIQNINEDILLNRRPSTIRSRAYNSGIDEFGFSEIRKLYGFGEVERTLKDPGIKSPIRSTVFSVIKKPFIIKPPEKFKLDERAIKLAKFMNLCKDMQKTSYITLFSEISSIAIGAGNGLAEKSFRNLDFDHPDFPGWRIYDDIQGRYNGGWDLKENSFNQILGIESLIEKGLVIDLSKFFFIVWDRQYGRNQGTGVVDSLYKLYDAKDIIYRQMVTYIQKFESPVPIVKIKDRRDQALMSLAQSIADNLYAGCGIVLPDELEAEFLTAGAKGDNPFLILFNWIDSQAVYLIKGHTGLSIQNGTGDGTGARASDETKLKQEGIYEWLLQITLQTEWAKQIRDPILEHNTDPNEYPKELYPEGVFESADIPTREDTRKDIETGYKVGAIDPKNNVNDAIEVRKKLTLSEMSEDEITEKQNNQNNSNDNEKVDSNAE